MTTALPVPTIPPARGAKHTCEGCATRFYDLNKAPPTCPVCNKKVVVLVKVARRKRSSRSSTTEDQSPLAAPRPAVTRTTTKLQYVKWK